MKKRGRGKRPEHCLPGADETLHKNFPSKIADDWTLSRYKVGPDSTSLGVVVYRCPMKPCIKISSLKREIYLIKSYVITSELNESFDTLKFTNLALKCVLLMGCQFMIALLK